MAISDYRTFEDVLGKVKELHNAEIESSATGDESILINTVMDKEQETNEKPADDHAQVHFAEHVLIRDPNSKEELHQGRG